MTVLDTGVTIAPRFCGPPESGNGGYVCGLAAKYLDGVAEVTLRVPPPLERPLSVVRTNEGHVELRDGDTLVAHGRAGELRIDPPTPPTLAAAAATRERYAGFTQHAFPTCFVCGPEREPHDGLCLFTGTVEGRELVAAPWTPHESLASDDGAVAPEFVWAALDCPGAFAVGLGKNTERMVLGRLTARLDRAVAVGEACVVVGWPLGGEGRKWYSGTALFTDAGDLCGLAQATWIVVPEPA